MAFVKRQITLIFTLSEIGAQFTAANGQSAGNVLTVEGARTKVRIEKNSGGRTSHAEVNVYGLTLDHMRALSRINAAQMVMLKNDIEILVSDPTNPANAPTSVFHGQITMGEIDISNEPDSALVVSASAGLYYAVAPAAGNSYSGAVPVTTVLSSRAQLMNLTPDFRGITGTPMLSDPHLSGSLMTQVQEICEAAGLNLFIDGQTMYVYDRHGSIPVATGTSIPIVSAATGMIGYPSVSAMGVAVKTLFSPFLNMGQQVKIESTLPYAAGEFGIYSLVHDLESQVPDGKWETSFHCSWADAAVAL